MNSLIFKEQAIKAIDDYTKGKPLYDYPWQIIEVIKSIPSAEKTGKWIDIGKFTDIDGNYHEAWKCDCCGFISYDDSNFCPNCGAKMVNNEEIE